MERKAGYSLEWIWTLAGILLALAYITITAYSMIDYATRDDDDDELQVRIEGK